jgi:hypothetical protein
VLWQKGAKWSVRGFAMIKLIKPQPCDLQF